MGVSLAEAVDPTTEIGVVNVRYADRTYAKIRDLKIFSTAIASAQAALSEATSVSISNIETTLQILEGDFDSLSEEVLRLLENQDEKINTFTQGQALLSEALSLKSESLTEDLQLLTTEFNSFKADTSPELLRIEDLEGSFDSFKDEVSGILENQSNTLGDQDEKIEVFIGNQENFREIQDQQIDSFISTQQSITNSLSQQISGFIESQQNLIEALIMRIDELESIVLSPP